MSQPSISKARASKAAFWAGWILTILPVLALCFSASIKFMNPPQAADQFKHLGWPLEYALGLGIVELACAVLYLIPPTSVLGAILVTGYLGGALATHVRLGEFPNMAAPIVLSILAWLGLYLRDPRLRALAPLRR
jgi:DoxX-like family